VRFAKRVFFWAGVYGLLTVVPMYFLEARIGIDDPPPITHPEYFYGFIGAAVAWQLAFLVVSRDPVRYRWLMVPAIVEKVTFGLAAAVLYSHAQLATQVFFFACIDLVLAALFAASFVATGDRYLRLRHT
jgi:hypothetical protein